ncbi:MAG TPA: MBL fold metallo-hydrolase [Chitinophagaceae bacterium]
METPEINATTLSDWLESGKKVTVLDVRPKEQREEWHIPGSIYVDAYKRLNAGDASVLDEVTIPANIPVVTVCSAGRTSRIAANELKKKGIEAYSLENGMKGWSFAWNSALIEFANYTVIQLRRTGKGCLSYIIISNKEANIIDASLPVEVYENILKESGWNLNAVLETHIHADHLSRSKQLAERFNVELFLPIPNKVTFPYQPLEPGQTLTFNKLSVKVIPTPGHTKESVSFLLNNEVLFTGDTLFTNSVGRPDLKADYGEAKQRAELLYDSLQVLKTLNDSIIVLPAHTNIPAAFDHKPIMATLNEIKKNVHLLNLSKSEFTETILAKLPPTPANFLEIVEKNLQGDFSDINPSDLEAGANRCAIN